MAKKPFISVDGITVGEASALVSVILANGDITTNNITISNNANLGSVGNIIITGGSSGYVLSTNGSGTLSWIAQSGGGGSTSNISNGNSNVSIATANGNITFSAVGNANIMTITGTGANITGTLNVSGNANVGNIGATNGVFTTVSGNGSSLSSITGANVTGTVANATYATTAGSASTAGYATSAGSATNATTAGYATTAGSATSADSALTAGTVTTAAQPNITSTGTLTSLTVSGTTNLGSVGNVTITGGTANYILKTNGSGTLSWTKQPTLSVIVDNFTGDGSNVAFTLSVAPANINFTTVNYNGLILLRSSYTVSGTTLTLSSAPAFGSLIEVTTLQFN